MSAPDAHDDVFPLVPESPAPREFPRYPPAGPSPENAPHCPECDYNLYGISEPRCPECGLDLTTASLPDTRSSQLDDQASLRVMRRDRILFWLGMAGYPLGMLFYVRSSPAATALSAILFSTIAVVFILLRAASGHALMPMIALCGGVWFGLHAVPWLLSLIF